MNRLIDRRGDRGLDRNGPQSAREADTFQGTGVTMKDALQPVDPNSQPSETPKSLKLRRADSCTVDGNGSPQFLTPIPEEPTPKSSAKRATTPISSLIELSKAGDVSPQRLEEELCKVIEGEDTEATTVTSPMLNEWLCGLGLRDAANTPARLELKALKRASNENVHLKKLLEKVKEVELEIAAEEAKSAAELWDCLEQECSELQEQNRGLRQDIEKSRVRAAQNDVETKELRQKMEGVYTDLQRTEEESAVLRQNLEELNDVLDSVQGGGEGLVGEKSQEDLQESVRQTIKRVETVIAERGRLEDELKAALSANKQQCEEQDKIVAKHETLMAELSSRERALTEQDKEMETFQRRLGEKDEACQLALEQQKELKKMCEVSEREKQEACEKALEACQEILQEQASMKEKYERVQKEKVEGYDKVLEAYQKALQDMTRLEEHCKEIEVEKQEACDAALRGEAHLKGKEEAFKIAMSESSKKREELQAEIEVREDSLEKMMEEARLLQSTVKSLQEKNAELEATIEDQQKSLESAVQERKQLESTVALLNDSIQEEQKKSREVEACAETRVVEKDVQVKFTQTSESLCGAQKEPIKSPQPAQSTCTDKDDSIESGIGLELCPRGTPTGGHVELKLNLDMPLSPGSPEPEASGRERDSAGEDVYDAALLHIRLKKFRQRNRGRRLAMPKSYDLPAEECRRRAAALGLRSSPIFRSKNYSRTKG